MKATWELESVVSQGSMAPGWEPGLYHKEPSESSARRLKGFLFCSCYFWGGGLFLKYFNECILILLVSFVIILVLFLSI